MWIINGTVTRRVKDTIEYISSEYTLHRDVYNIVQLQLSDNNTVYYSMIVTSTHKHVEGNDSITLTIDKSMASIRFIYTCMYNYTCVCMHASVCMYMCARVCNCIGIHIYLSNATDAIIQYFGFS